MSVMILVRKLDRLPICASVWCMKSSCSSREIRRDLPVVAGFSQANQSHGLP